MSPSRFSQANGTCGPYKPVPAPKPFAGNPIMMSQQHHLQQQEQIQHQKQPVSIDSAHSLLNGHSSYPHILFTEQGQFVTHSLKFPIVDENEKLVQAFNETNSVLSQGIDNPALLPDPQSQQSAGDRNQHKETSPNHYAQMGPFDPSRHPHYLQNGHSQTFTRASFLKSYPQQGSRENHIPQNSVRFATPLAHQSPSKAPQLNEQSLNNQLARESSYYPLSQSQYAALMRGTTVAGFEPGKDPHYQDVNTGAYDLSGKFSSHCGKANGVLPSSQANGLLPHPDNSGAYVQSKVKGGISHAQRNSSFSAANQFRYTYGSANGDVNMQNVDNQETSTATDANDDSENKRGSIKRAGKKYSHLKQILCNKFTKPEPKLKATATDPSVSFQSKGTNSKELSTNDSNDQVLNSERLLNAQKNGNFQRVVTYSSLNSKLDNPHQLTYNASILAHSERTSGRTSHNPGVSFPLNSYGNQNTAPANANTGPKRAESCSYLGVPGQEQNQISNPWETRHRSDDNLTRVLASDQSYPEQNTAKDGPCVHFQPGREGRVSGGSDSGRGTGAGSEFKRHDTSLESGSSNRVPPQHGHSSGNESEWIDIPEEEGTQTCFRKSSRMKVQYPHGVKTPPLPPLSPLSSPKRANRGVPFNAKKSSSSFSSRGNKKPDIVETTEQNGGKPSLHLQNVQNASKSRPAGTQPAYRGKWNEVVINKHNTAGRETALNGLEGRFHGSSGNEESWHPHNKQFDDDELTSTDVLDLNSVLDEATEATSDDDNASTRDADSYLIQRQLEGLEGMYTEVLKVLGSRRNLRSENRLSRRRTHGSVSSLPSSVMSNRGPRDRKGRVIDDRLRKASKDVPKTTHKRFQRIESHVVTLARSVAHLSSEMRTQHLMLQEIENLRNDVSALKLSVKSPTVGPSRAAAFRASRFSGAFGASGPSWSHPSRVKKLTQFFGDEPPLVRIFLRKLGYEKYAPIFEQEKIGMLELPYMTEERLEKIGIPLGPRLRIIEEAQGPITTDGNLSVYVV